MKQENMLKALKRLYLVSELTEKQALDERDYSEAYGAKR